MVARLLEAPGKDSRVQSLSEKKRKENKQAKLPTEKSRAEEVSHQEVEIPGEQRVGPSQAEAMPAQQAGPDELVETSEVEDRETDADDEGSDLEKAMPHSMASAFAEILAHPGPSQKGVDAPILLGSKTLAKRKRQELEANAAQTKARNLRQEIRQRAHKKVTVKGEDPEADTQERLLQKIATRGVVQLFNAVSKAQKARQEALASGSKSKDAKISKSDFFSELKRDVQKQGKQKEAEPEDVARTWDVLQPSFGGLQGKTATKMKDWDKDVTPEGSESAGASLSSSEEEAEDEEENVLGVW